VSTEVHLRMLIVGTRCDKLPDLGSGHLITGERNSCMHGQFGYSGEEEKIPVAALKNRVHSWHWIQYACSSF
jgi:hypothetical protein